MTLAINWPALTDVHQTAASLNYERAAYGKVHNAPTDYRWMARSSGLGQIAGLEKLLALGSEKAASLFCWRATADRYYAVHCYPSRAVDRDHRRGFLERQVVCISRAGAAMPVPWIALAALSKVAEFTGGPWTQSWQDRRWEDPEHSEPFYAEDLLPIRIEKDAMQKGMQVALDVLKETVAMQADALESLTLFYAALLSNNRPAPLIGVAGIFPPAAFAALLLPLPANVAAEISIAGGVPSTDLPQSSSRNWDAIVTTEGGPVFWPAEIQVKHSVLEQARRIARALVSNNPAELLLNEMVRRNVGTFAASNTDAGDAVTLHLEKPSPRPPAADLTKRPAVPSKPVLAFEDFVFSGARMLNPDVMRDPENSAEVTLSAQVSYLYWSFRAFKKTIEEPGRSSSAVDHLQTKLDILRSWLYMLAPSNDTIDEVGLPTTGRVPALWAAVYLDQNAFERLERINRGWEKLVEQSLRSALLIQSEKQALKQFLQKWKAWTKRSEIRQYLTNLNELFQTSKEAGASASSEDRR
jgi:hypothetical protein